MLSFCIRASWGHSFTHRPTSGHSHSPRISSFRILRKGDIGQGSDMKIHCPSGALIQVLWTCTWKALDLHPSPSFHQSSPLSPQSGQHDRAFPPLPPGSGTTTPRLVGVSSLLLRSQCHRFWTSEVCVCLVLGLARASMAASVYLPVQLMFGPYE